MLGIEQEEQAIQEHQRVGVQRLRLRGAFAEAREEAAGNERERVVDRLFEVAANGLGVRQRFVTRAVEEARAARRLGLQRGGSEEDEEVEEVIELVGFEGGGEIHLVVAIQPPGHRAVRQAPDASIGKKAPINLRQVQVLGELLPRRALSAGRPIEARPPALCIAHHARAANELAGIGLVYERLGAARFVAEERVVGRERARRIVGGERHLDFIGHAQRRQHGPHPAVFEGLLLESRQAVLLPREQRPQRLAHRGGGLTRRDPLAAQRQEDAEEVLGEQVAVDVGGEELHARD